jgi:hypothetical protein
MQSGAPFSALQVAVALACLIAAPGGARASEADDGTAAYAAVDPAGDAQAAKPLTPDESALLGNALLYDPAGVADARPPHAVKLPSLSKPQDLSIDGSENADGSAKVVVKKPLALSDWNANVGADLNTAAPPVTSFEPGKPFPGTVENAGSGSVWASVDVSKNTSVVARVTPSPDQNQFGGGVKQSIPLGDKFSLTVQDKVSVTDTYVTPPAAPATASGLPLMTAPTAPATQTTPQVIGNDRSVKLDIKPTGTTLGAGFTSATNDPVTHNTLSADQTIYGPLHVTTAVTDVGQTTSSKSITAGFKLNW